jgi:ribosomal protein S27E
MSRPVTDAEREQDQRTNQAAGPAENVVSTACPGCEVRFACLVTYDRAGWHLRCTLCGWVGMGELKTQVLQPNENCEQSHV